MYKQKIYIIPDFKYSTGKLNSIHYGNNKREKKHNSFFYHVQCALIILFDAVLKV